ncbi:DUF2057 family protein [Paraferrimonas sedimenticola]|uniref:DUF2057 domain-containing protein n=1 Tax=Paraferrimonas sedimenticola TaxID=375674 RepID=A0AA37RWS4_9GAMM|nr:DUF2057 family protein [Paraferrimonas sedimenticola]GLP96738.1 hypothetical protein GCM10007895_20440 [Paraferrimonas sedimenticola]
MNIKTLLTATLFSAVASTSVFAGELKLPEYIDALELNGQDIAAFQDVIPLGEGRQVLTLQYKQLHYTGTDSHDFILSTPFYLVVDNQGDPIELVTDKIVSVQEAMRFSSAPKAMIKSNGRLQPANIKTRDELLAQLALQTDF